MTSRTEQIASQKLRAVLTPLSPGSAIEDSDDFRWFQTTLEFFIPTTLAETYRWWRGESLDGFRFAVARKLGPGEAEFIGLCLLITDQCEVPFYLRLRIAAQTNNFEWLECKLGESGSGKGGLVRDSNRADRLLYFLAERLDSIPWAYTITRGAPQHAAMRFYCPCCGFPGLDESAYENLGPPPWGDLGEPPYASRLGEPSYEVCTCCGFEYGFDDETATIPGRSFAQYLAEWIREGQRWVGRDLPPPSWDLKTQLAEAGISWPSENW